MICGGVAWVGEKAEVLDDDCRSPTTEDREVGPVVEAPAGESVRRVTPASAVRTTLGALSFWTGPGWQDPGMNEAAGSVPWAWEQQRVWSLTANHLKARIDRRAH